MLPILASVFVISLSGVLQPGIMLAMVIAKGYKSPWAGEAPSNVTRNAGESSMNRFWILPGLIEDHMTISDVFRLKWKSSDRTVRLEAVRQITDQPILREVALADSDRRVCKEAVERLTDPKILEEVARTASHEVVRRLAVHRIEDQAILADLARTAKVWSVRAAAVKKIEDSDLLAALTREDPVWSVRVAAVEMLQDRDRIYHDLGRDPMFDQRLIGWLNEFRGKARKTFHAPEEIHALDHMRHDMRVYKSRDELSAMRRAARVAIEAHEEAMRGCQPGLNEADIHAGLLHAFTRNGCEPSYLPIVGGGANACVLHYISNRDELHDGDLLLIDAGAEYDGYASDITRTFPVNGKFSPEQRELYGVVLAAQAAAIDKARAGNQWQDVHDAAVRVATEGMVELGILKNSVDEEIESSGYKHFYVHNTGHWLGLDVHDVGEYTIDGHSRELEPGMVMTVEPGIYIQATEESVPARWRGLGIRIEDNVAITRDDPRVLTDGLARTADEIEALMAG